MSVIQEEAIRTNTDKFAIAVRKLKPGTAIKPRLSPLSGEVQKYQRLVGTISNTLRQKKK